MPKYYFISIIFLAISGYAVEIVIREEFKEPASKPEENKPDLPELSKLSVNVINLTDYSYAVYSNVQVKDDDSQGILSQNKITPQYSHTVVSMFASPGSLFEYIESQVLVLDKNLTVSCKLIGDPGYSKSVEEVNKKIKELDKKRSTLLKEIEQDDDNKELKNSLQEVNEELKNIPDTPPFAAKKSVDFYLYQASGDELPSCAIYFDVV